MGTDTSEKSYRTFDDVAADVPRHGSFFTLREHRERDRALADAHDHVSLDVLGESSDGNEIWSLTVGEGSYTAFMFAAPHPNEPIGSMTVDFLAHRLAEDDELRDSLDYEFVLLKAIDVDGTRLNQGWFDGPFTISNYAQNFYRPAATEQAEWTFPIEYRDYAFDEPVPETQVLMDVIEEKRPEFIYSLHNAGFGGCYYYLSHDLEELYDDLRGFASSRSVPLHLGEPEVPWASEFDDAMFGILSLTDNYDFLADETDADPTELLTAGAGSYDFAREHNEDVVELLTELPYFYDEAIESDEPTDSTRREVILEGADRREAIVDFLTEQYDRVADDLPDTRLTRAVAELTETAGERIESTRSWARDAEELTETATVAQRLDALTIGRFYLVLYVGTFLRALDHAAMTTEDEAAAEALVETKADVERRFHGLVSELLEELDYEAIPIHTLVAIQTQAGLRCLDHLQRTDRFD